MRQYLEEKVLSVYRQQVGPAAGTPSAAPGGAPAGDPAGAEAPATGETPPGQ
jgi:hypothetical protein